MFNNRISKKEFIDFNKSFSLMLMSKLTVVQALEIMYSQTRGEKLKHVIKRILSDIKAGNSLSKSFGKHPHLFSEIYIANLKVAEETGQIAEVLTEYTGYLEKMQGLKQKIIQAGRYPMLVLLVTVGVVFFMVFFLIPTFESLFSSSKITLPLLTQVIVSFSYGIKNNLYLLLFLLAITVMFLFNAKKSSVIKYKYDRFLITLPLVSKLYRKNLLARFSLSMGIMLKSKITLLEALKVSRNISGNMLFKAEIDKVIKQVTKGESFSINVNKSVLFDITFSRLLTVGEQSAELEKVFYLISDYYGKEFDYSLDNLTSLLEPVLIITVGLTVAVILIAMYMPMFELINYFGV